MAASFRMAIRASSRGSRLFRQSLGARLPVRFMATTKLELAGKRLVMTSQDSGKPVETQLSKIWLRDNCRCEKCVNQDTMQRNFNTFEIPENITPRSIEEQKKGVDIVWSDEHKSHYSWEWLRTAAHGSPKQRGQDVELMKFWHASIASSPPSVAYHKVMDKDDISGMADLTHKIRVYGFAFVVNSPQTPEATKELLESIGPIRNTHYGGFYDFIPDLAKADTAYTNLALAAHTDTTYFTEPAGLQAFHMLSHTPPPNEPSDQGSLGGQSLLVDGFHAAHRLRMEFPRAYHHLNCIKVPWHASGNQGIAIAPDMAYPVIETASRKVHRIRWNNDDRGIVPTHVDVDKWYDAARKWDSIVRREEFEYWFQLQPGRILIFDNWRVMHGRSAFNGVRRICGGYINRDDFISRWKTTNFPNDKVILGNMLLQ